ncbi:MAG: hypothetical protein M1833_002103 [Piccolia ochrophora]|nr:MAG: hypothetical protein M1833_002103 [Piccolia ochrophora]
MYGDTDYGRRNPRPLSYVASPESEIITARPPTAVGSPLSRPNNARSASNEKPTGIMSGQGPLSPSRSSSLGNENGSLSPSLSLRERSPHETANSHFPLNDVDYESSPAAVAQEMSNLQALRRMSMVDNAAGDPDLPSYNSPLMPTTAPTGADDEEDTSRLFWVPARIHPELAPKEFKTFLENRVDQIKRRSGDESPLSPEGMQRQGSGSLRRKKSMLSKQIDNSGGSAAEGYRDGAERLERQRSLYTQQAPDLKVSDLQDLDVLVQDPSKLMRKLSIDTTQAALEGNPEAVPGEDVPILPAAPPGQSLRRSTRTTYRRGSLRKGERVPLSKRAARAAETDTEESPAASPVGPGGDPSAFKLSRIQTEPLPASSPPTPVTNDDPPENFSRPSRLGRTRAVPPGASPTSSFDDILSHADRAEATPSRASTPSASFAQRVAGERTAHVNLRSSAPVYGVTDSSVPRIVETPPPPEGENAELPSVQARIPERVSSHEPPPSMPPQGPLPHGPPSSGRQKRPTGARQPPSARTNGQTLNDIVGQPSPLPGNSTRTDSLSFIPTFSEDKKVDKKGRDKKEKEGHEASGSRKSSWGWLLGSEEKEKDKETQKKGKVKSPKGADKGHDTARLDLLQTSIDGNRGRESLVLDRENFKLEEERRKESSRKASGGETKKDSGLFSFFGGKKKGDRDHQSKKDRSSRGLSPDPPHRDLKPDIDYNWTRFSILEERAIYRMAHIKLANPRRALYSQVLLSNFMYSYLAKVQQMHPQIQIPQSAAQKQQRQAQQLQQQQQHDSNNPQDGQYYQYGEQQAPNQPQRYQNHAGRGNRGGGGGDQYGDNSQSYDYEPHDDHGRPQSRASQHDARDDGADGSHHMYYHHQQHASHQSQHSQQSQHEHSRYTSQFDDQDEDDDEMW